MRRRPAGFVAAALAGALAASPGAGQRDTVLAAGARYAAGPLHRAVLGSGYRDAWIAPIRVAFLDLDTVAGGLTPTELGGGNQTVSLRFRGADGREYAFRSVDKDPVRTHRADLGGTMVGRVLRDLVSAQHPSGQLALDPLLDALGVLHAPPRLYVMPDDPRLGEHRARLAGMLGYFEERPDAGRSGIPGLADADDLEGTEDFLGALGEDSRNRFDERDYLAMRLLDLVIGDWDRHGDQFRWARFDSAGTRLWRPVPRDRDYAFVAYGGLGPGVVRGVYPKAVRFGPDPSSDLFGLLQNAQPLDRRLLGGLDRAAWDSVTAEVERRLTDPVIDAAIARLPEPHRARTGAALASRLRERRANLRATAARYYAWMAVEPEIHARDADDVATLTRQADGALTVEVAAADAAEPYFRRRFLPGETREVRLHLAGGDDRALVRGEGPGRIGIRIVGGAGDDLLADSSRHGDTRFYDHQGRDRFVTRRGTRVDTRPFTPVAWSRERGSAPHRDWGRTSSVFSPHADWRGRVGPVLGGGPSWTDYGFRRHPVEDRGAVRALYAPLEHRFGLEYDGAYHFTGDRRWLEVEVRATGLVGTDFYGLGNDTPRRDDDEERRFFERQLRVEPTWHVPLGERGWLNIGPTLELRDPEPGARAVARVEGVPGAGEWGALGGRVGVELDGRDAPAFPRRGVRLVLEADAFPAVDGLDGPFGAVRADASTYLAAGAGPVLALRGGGRLAWGDYPLQRAALLGGKRSLRGHAGDRFAGDVAAFGGAEVRLPLIRANLLMRGTLGLLGLADAGRVWVDGDSDGGWHTAVGGGAFFTVLEGSRTASLYLARGEVTRLYAQLGIPF